MSGWYGMACWNGLSADQQAMLIDQGVLPFGRWIPEGGTCSNGAEVAIETQWDEAPGPRFLCRACAIVHLLRLGLSERPDPDTADDGCLTSQSQQP